MTWNNLTTRQQNTARRFRSDLADAGIVTSVSQVAKYLDEVFAWKRGDLTVAQLAERTGWEYQPAERQVTAAELAASLGVSLSTIYRRIRAGLLKAVKENRRWVITITA